MTQYDPTEYSCSHVLLLVYRVDIPVNVSSPPPEEKGRELFPNSDHEERIYAKQDTTQMNIQSRFTSVKGSIDSSALAISLLQM